MKCLSLIEDSYAKFKKRIRNKLIHSQNGNRNQDKKKKYIKVLEINKGNSYFNTNVEVLKILVKEENPTICFLRRVTQWNLMN